LSRYSDNKKPSGGAILLICSTEIGGDIENCSFYVVLRFFYTPPLSPSFLAAIFALFDVHVRIYCGKRFLLHFFEVSVCAIFLHIPYETQLETTPRDPVHKNRSAVCLQKAGFRQLNFSYFIHSMCQFYSQAEGIYRYFCLTVSQLF